MSQLLTAIEPTSTDEAELDVARQIQSTFVSDRGQAWPGARTATKRIAGGGLGGDFHHVARGLDEQYAVMVGTVTGPRMFAALAKAVLSGAARSPGAVARAPAVQVAHLSGLLSHINENLRGERVLCSVFYGLIDRSKGVLEFCNAGRFHPLIWTREAEVRDLGATAPALGQTGGFDCRTESLELGSLRRLVVYTNGLTTARTASGVIFGEARGRRLLVDTLHLPVNEQVDAALQALRDHVGRDRVFTDDLTVFVTEFTDTVAVTAPESVKTRFQAYERATGAAPDSSVFLG